LLFNENKTDETCCIMKELQKYVPRTTYQLTYNLPEGDDFVTKEECFHRILFGGDQLTTCQSYGGQSADDHSDKRLNGLCQL